MMIKENYRVIVALSLLMAAAMYPAFGAEGPGGKKSGGGTRVSSPAQIKGAGVLNINNLVCWYQANGLGAYGGPSIQGDGSAFPRGTSHPFFADGVVWGANAYLDAAHTQPAPFQTIRVGGNTYNSGNREGWITGTGATAVAVPSTDPRARIYRVRRDYATMSTGELKQDALENLYFGGTLSQVTDADVATITAQYATDWDEWPTDLGAPYIERNGVPGYQKPPAFGPNFTVDSLISGHYDEPGIAGADPNSPADQVMWAVDNDLDPGAMIPFEGSESMGLEMQLTIWGYKRTDALGNLFFKRIRLINKGGTDVNTARTQKGALYLDSMFIAQWADPDLGDAGDDLDGCDTSLSVGYVYNGNAIDNEYKKFGLPPPSAGYDFLAGPIVPSPGDSAVFDLKVKHDFRNLPMTSFAWFAAGSAISDPPFTYEGALEWWKMLRGYVPDPSTQVDRLYPVAPGFAPTRFPLSGDPVARTGLVDGLGETYSFAPGDRRLVLCSGPFELAPGDTEEIVVGQLAGLGSDRLSSISVMKFNDRFVQNTYNALFQVPKPPAAPNVAVSELDRKVILDWGSDLAGLANTETRVNEPGGYKFEGYNVYQFPSTSATLQSAKRIATYDLETDPTVVLDEQFDVNSGQILTLPVQFGTNSGVKRYFQFTRDYIRDIDQLWNGQDYFLAVTAYSVASVAGYLPASLESQVRILTVRPKIPFGTVFQTKSGDTLKVTHLSGVSDGIVTPIVVSPAASNGDTYQVRFDSAANWSLFNVTENHVVLADQTNQSGDANYSFVEGSVFLKVSGPKPGMKEWSIPSGTRRFSPVGGFIGLGLEGFSSAGDPTAYDQDNGTIGMAGHFAFGGIGTTLTVSDYHTTLLKLAAVDQATLWDPTVAQTDTNFSLAYRYLRAAANPPADPSFAPWIKTAASGYPYQDFGYGVPFSAWDMSTNPPTRLAVGHFENNVVDGRVDGRYWPYTASDAVDNITAREFCFIFNHPYTTTPDPALEVNMSGNASTPLMWVMVCSRRAAVDWVAGDQFQITAAGVNLPADVFQYTLPAPKKTIAEEKASVNRIKVFPNPYYAFNPAETDRFVRFVTFNNMPRRAKVSIYNLAGQLVRTMNKDDDSQFLRWDLNNQSNFPVASGIYIGYLELTLSTGEVTTKIVKMAIIQEQEVPNTYGERAFQ